MQGQQIWKSEKWEVVVNQVVYVEGLKHNLISVYRLVIGTSNLVLFDEDFNVVSNKEMNEVFLK